MTKPRTIARPDNKHLVEYYCRAIKTYPFPGFLKHDKISTIAASLSLIGKIYNDEANTPVVSPWGYAPVLRLPRHYDELPGLAKKVFATCLAIGQFGIKETAQFYDEGSLELSELEYNCLLYLLKLKVNLLDRGDIFDNRHLHSTFAKINGTAWSGHQILMELQTIARVCDFSDFNDINGLNAGEGLVRFLSQYRIPEVWHNYTAGVNFDCGVTDELNWIIRQNECDAGTAILLLQRLNAHPLDVASNSCAEYELCNYVFQKAASGGFKRFKCQLSFSSALYLTKLYQSILTSNTRQKRNGEPQLSNHILEGCQALLRIKPETQRCHTIVDSDGDRGLTLVGVDEDFAGEYKTNPPHASQLAKPAHEVVYPQ